jgi:adenine-specific DNA-methyltransferase
MAKEVLKRGQWPRLYFTKDGEGGIRRKSYLEQMEGRVVTNLWRHEEVGHTDEAKKELKDIFGGTIPFDTPKPVRLIERILQIATRPDSIVLDSFAGSGTTAHAVMKLNAKDGGRRRFLLIEMMDYAEATTAERVKRVICGYATKQRHEVELYSKRLTTKNLTEGAELMREAEQTAAENRDKYSSVSGPKIEDGCLKVTASTVIDGKAEGLGGSFDYYEVGAPLFTADGYVSPEVKPEQLRNYVYYTETQSAPEPYEAGIYLMGNHNGCAYYLYHEAARHTTLSFDTLSEIVTERAGHYVIYADSCTLSEEFMTAHNITFKKLPRDIKRF